MKKCIASFLICFVFAFGVISAFGCRDEVYASDTFTPFGIPITGETKIFDSFLELDSDEEWFSDVLSVISVCDDEYCFFYRSSNDERVLKALVYSVNKPITFQSHYSSQYGDGSISADRVSDEGCLSVTFSYDGVPITLYYAYITTGYQYNQLTNRQFQLCAPLLIVDDDAYQDSLNLKNILLAALGVEDYSDIVLGVESNISFEYSDEIGYLANLRVVQKNYENNATHQIKERVYAFSWDYKTSTGVDLSDSRYALDIKARLEYQDLAYDDLEIDDSPLCNTYKYESNWTDLYNSATNCQDAYSSDSIFSRTGFNTIYYFRILDTETNTCGKWLKADINFNGLLVDALDEETGDFDDSGTWVGDGNHFSGVGGTQNGDNESTLVTSDSSGKLDYSGIGDSISSLVDGVGQVPSVIAMLFSWLPTWVIVFLSVSIAIWGIMIVKKAIFG